MRPTVEQLKSFYTLCASASNLLQTIELTRFDTRTNRIVVLIGDNIQVEILPNGSQIIR